MAKPPAHAALGGLVMVTFLRDTLAAAILEVEGCPHKRIGQSCGGGVTEFDKEQTGGGASEWGPLGFDNEATSEGV